jgi:hypothetical protein
LKLECEHCNLRKGELREIKAPTLDYPDRILKIFLCQECYKDLMETLERLKGRKKND